MPKEYKIVMTEKMSKKTVCVICGKKYGGERGMKLHFKYSHGIILTKEDFDNREIFFKCQICKKNVINCGCSISRKIKLIFNFSYL